jgi:cysteine-S-conjugate beta-lyase
VDDPCYIPIERLRKRTSVKWSLFGPDVLPAWVAEMDFALAAPVKQALREAIDLDDTGYAHPEASGLAGAFSGFSGRRFGWKPDPDRVVAVADVVGGLRSLLRALASPGDRVVVTPPVYHPFFSLVTEAGCDVAEAPLSPSGELDLDRIESEFRAGAAAMLLCSPHNPTGRVVPEADQKELARLAERHGVWILSDEIHAPLALDGARHRPFLTVSDEAAARGICVTSASKAFNLAGLSCAVIATESAGAAKAVERLAHGDRHPSHLGVIASAAAFESGDGWLDSVLHRLSLNRSLLGELLDSRAPGVRWTPPEAGYLAWLDCRETGLGPDPALGILERGSVALSSGPQFGRGGTGFCRLNFGTAPELIEAAVDGVAAALEGA